MNKKIVIIITIIVGLILSGVICAVLFLDFDNTNPMENIDTSVYQAPKNTVMVSPWNKSKCNDNDLYTMFKCSIEDSKVNTIFEKYTTFTSKETLNDIANSNKEDFIKDIEYYDNIFSKYDAKLYFKDDNYYVFYKLEDLEDGRYRYYAGPACGLFSIETDDYWFPCPNMIYIENEYMKTCLQDFNTNMLSALFDKYSFDEVCDFYKRMSDKYYTIDNENKCISVTIFNGYNGEIVEDFLTFDFNKKNVSWTDKAGNKNSTDGVVK